MPTTIKIEELDNLQAERREKRAELHKNLDAQAEIATELGKLAGGMPANMTRKVALEKKQTEILTELHALDKEIHEKKQQIANGLSRR